MSIPVLSASPVVEKNSFLTLHYRLAGPMVNGQAGGDIINTFNDKPATLSLGAGELAPALEQHLLGLAEGTRATFELAPGEAFGGRNPDLLQWVAGTLLDELNQDEHQYTIGDVVQFPTPDGLGQYAGTVQQLGEGDADGKSKAVQFDFNHPLAGQSVVFEVLVIGIL